MFSRIEFPTSSYNGNVPMLREKPFDKLKTCEVADHPFSQLYLRTYYVIKNHSHV